MLDKEGETRPRDLVHIQVDELAYWTDALEVDETTLRGALQAVGFLASDVRDYLIWRRAATPAA